MCAVCRLGRVQVLLCTACRRGWGAAVLDFRCVCAPPPRHQARFPPAPAPSCPDPAPQEVYQMITCGGDAELELVDSLDPFSEVRVCVCVCWGGGGRAAVSYGMLTRSVC